MRFLIQHVTQISHVTILPLPQYISIYFAFLLIICLFFNRMVTWLSGDVFNAISHWKRDHISHDLPLNTLFLNIFAFLHHFSVFSPHYHQYQCCQHFLENGRWHSNAFHAQWMARMARTRSVFHFFRLFSHFFAFFLHFAPLILTNSPQATPTPPSMWKVLTRMVRMARTWWVSACLSLFSTFFRIFSHFSMFFVLILTDSPQATPTPPSKWKWMIRMARI